MPAQRTTRRFVTLAALIFCATPVTPAAPASRQPWATVNVCDTAASPDTIGLRGSMPGNGSAKVRMFMRFRVEYFVARENAWKLVRRGGDSGWIRVGSGKYAARETGRSFQFSPASGNILLRGRVSYEWRRGSRVVKRATRRTEAGHTSSAGADPQGFSAAECLIRK